MKKLILSLFLFAAFAHAQSGTATFTPPAPGKITITTTTGKISGTMSGNTIPATAVNFSMTVNGVNISFTMPLSPGQSYTDQWTFVSGGITDSVTPTFTNTAGTISFSVVVDGGAPLNGSF